MKETKQETLRRIGEIRWRISKQTRKLRQYRKRMERIETEIAAETMKLELELEVLKEIMES